MARRTYKEKVSTKQVEVEEQEPLKTEDKDILTITDEVLQDIDDILDDVLGEVSAQAFVGAYLQKGGE